jgi:hypothetical protein
LGTVTKGETLSSEGTVGGLLHGIGKETSVSKSDALENDLLDLLFKGVAIADLAENDTTSPAATLYFSLHSADPGEGGSQTTNEIAYTSYARVGVARGAGFTVSGNSVSPAANVDFPPGTGGSGTATHFGIGTAASGAGYLMYSGPISPSIVCGNGVTPRLTTASTVTED